MRMFYYGGRIGFGDLYLALIQRTDYLGAGTLWGIQDGYANILDRITAWSRGNRP